MNVYDFDKTIYPQDSTAAFYRWCLVRHPSVLRYVPVQLHAFCQHYLFHSIDKTEMKTRFFRFFRILKNPEREAELFWEAHIRNVEQWYLEQQQADDVIISASPEFLLRPVANRLGFHLIASEVDSATGVFSSPNCHDVEKPKRFYAQFPGAAVDAFYSDSLSDSPMAKIAANSYLVDHGKRVQWPVDSLDSLKN